MKSATEPAEWGREAAKLFRVSPFKIGKGDEVLALKEYFAGQFSQRQTIAYRRIFKPYIRGVTNCGIALDKIVKGRGCLYIIARGI